MKTMNETIDKHAWWVLLIVGTIGGLFANYYVIIFARILWVFGFADILVKSITWIENWKSSRHKVSTAKLVEKTQRAGYVHLSSV